MCLKKIPGVEFESELSVFGAQHKDSITRHLQISSLDKVEENSRILDPVYNHKIQLKNYGKQGKGD